MLRGTNQRVLSGVMCGRQRRGGVIIMVSVIIIIMVSVHVLISVVSFHRVISSSASSVYCWMSALVHYVYWLCFLPQTLGKLKEKSSILFSSSGPDYWGTINPEWALCHKGKQQSPIDIEPSRLLYDPNLKHLKIESTYVSTNSFKIHTWWHTYKHEEEQGSRDKQRKTTPPFPHIHTKWARYDNNNSLCPRVVG